MTSNGNNDHREELSFERYAIEAKYFDSRYSLARFAQLTPDEQKGGIGPREEDRR